MYVCMCNPFTDKDVKKALENCDIRNTPAHIYKACSGGNTPQCGTCIHTIKDLIVDYHSSLGVLKLIEDMPELADLQSEYAK